MTINKDHIAVKIFFILLILCVITTAGCRKRKENSVGPVISQFTVNGNNFLWNDTISYSVQVESEEIITSVSVFICGTDMQPVTAAQVKEVQQQYISFSEEYIYANRYLDAGSYYLVCSAVNSSGITRSYLSIQIIPLARQVERFMILVNDNGYYRIGSLNSVFDSVAFHLSLPSLPVDAIVNSQSRQLNVLFANGTLKSYDFPDFQEVWLKSNLHHPSAAYESEIQVISGFTCCGTAYGKIAFFDETGMQRKTVYTGSGEQVICRKFLVSGDKIISYNTGYLNGITQVAVSSLSGGGLISEYPVMTTVIDLSPYTHPDILLWTSAGLFTFNTISPLIYKISDYPINPLHRAMYISENNYLLAAGSSVYSYNPQYNAYFVQQMNDGENMFYDPLNQTLFIVKQNRLSVYAAGQLINETIFPFEPVKVFAVYNK